jgi:hypothetical protein
VTYDWPFAWMTVDPIPGYHRTGPRLEYLPPILQARYEAPEADGLGAVAAAIGTLGALARRQRARRARPAL